MTLFRHPFWSVVSRDRQTAHEPISVLKIAKSLRVKELHHTNNSAHIYESKNDVELSSVKSNSFVSNAIRSGRSADRNSLQGKTCFRSNNHVPRFHFDSVFGRVSEKTLIHV